MKALVAALGVFCAAEAMASPQVTILGFDDLNGWAEDDHDAALTVFRNTCTDMPAREWRNLCALATSQPDARAFFELFFLPVLIEDGEEMLFTGYFEPELSGSRERDGRYLYPIYMLPPDMPSSGPWLTRQEIDEGALEGRALELAWLANPVDLFFLQVQGSGRIRMDDGTMMRVGYGGSNRHPYSSIGQALIRRGEMQSHEVSADAIRSWVQLNPEKGRELLWTNRSYVFFREVSEVPPHLGPLGAMNRSITDLRSIAVDPDYTPLGAPVWIEREGDSPMNRLMVAQDTGSAIKGAQRADIFFGTGLEAGREAGQVRDTGRMVVLMPIELALALRDGAAE